jgi:hypothetical protein
MELFNQGGAVIPAMEINQQLSTAFGAEPECDFGTKLIRQRLFKSSDISRGTV